VIVEVLTYFNKNNKKRGVFKMKKIVFIMIVVFTICVVSPSVLSAGCCNPYIAAGILGGAILGSAVISNSHDRVYYVVEDHPYDRCERHRVTYHYHDGYNEIPFYPDHCLPDSVTQMWQPGWTEKNWDGSYTYHPGRYIYVERNIER
jgi:hypothetical protein